jgi:amino acid adenylation domain-containing protein
MPETTSRGGGPRLSEVALLTDWEHEEIRLRRLPSRPAYPLSFPQRELWFATQRHPRLEGGWCAEVSVSGPLDTAAFLAAVRAAADRHEALRAAFATADGRTVQRIAECVAVDCPLEDLSSLAPAHREATLRARADAMASAGFALETAPLFRAWLLRLEATEHVFLFAAHRLILDRAGFGELLAEIGRAYAAGVRGGAEASPGLAVQYPDFADWQERRLKRGVLVQHKASCRRQLRSPLPKMALPRDHRPTAARSFSTALVERRLRPDLVRSPLIPAVLTVVEVLLWRLTGETDLMIAVPISTRPPELREAVGLFTSLRPLRIAFDPRRSFRELSKEAARLLGEAAQRSEFPWTELARALEVRPDADRPLLPVCVSEHRSVELTAGDVALRPRFPTIRSSEYDLEVVVCSNDRDEVELRIVYGTELFERHTVERLAASLESLLEAAATDPDLPISELRRSTNAARGVQQERIPLARRGERGSFPLSLNQRDMWLQERIHGGGGLNNLSLQVELRGPLDEGRLREALQEVVDRQEALRAVFEEGDGEGRQRIEPAVRVSCPLRELSGLEAAGQAEAVRARNRELLATALDVEHGPLFRTELLRLGEREHRLLFVFHHLVLDGFYVSQFLEELAAAYGARLQGNGGRAQPLEPSYGDFAAWQDERLRRGELEEHGEYWRRQLEGPPPGLALDREAGRGGGFDFGSLEWPVPPEVLAALEGYGKRYATTLFRLVLAAFEALLFRLSGQGELLLAIPFSTRPPSLREVIGFFAHAVPVRVERASRWRFSELLRDVDRQLREAGAHREYPLSEVLRGLKLERDLSRPLVPVCVSQVARCEQRVGELTLSTGASFSQGEVYDLMLTVMRGRQGLELGLWYNRALFARSTMVQVADSFGRLLEAVAADPETRLSELEWVGEEQRRRVLALGRGVAEPAEEDWPEERIARVAAEHPERVALVSGTEQLHYAELERRAEWLAGGLARRAVGREDRVGILGRRGLGLWTTVLGVMKSGAAFVPLEPSDPEERLRAVVRAAGLKCLAVGADFVEQGRRLVEGTACELFDWDSAEQGPSAPCPRLSGQDLAYVFYTSGSTGTPKGVMVSRAGMSNHLRSKVELLGLSSEDVVVQNAAHSFDVSVWQCVSALMVGARVVVYGEELAWDAGAMVRAVKADQARVLETVPSFLELLLGVEGVEEGLGGLRYLVSNAETLSVPLVRRWFERCPGVGLLNTWGATECADDVTVELMRGPLGEEAVRVGVGRPVRGTRVYVVDEELRPVGVGCAGEIAVAGVCVGRGYVGEPALSAERFVPDPFAEEEGSRLYLSGDLGRWNEEGSLEFLGRRDGQVKVRGHRVEVAEVEGALSGHPGVSQAVVELKQGRLVGYWVGEGLASAELRGYLGQRLPGYMVPEALVRLSELPRTRSGKLDRRTLPEPKWDEEREGYLAPRSDVEAQIAEVWQEVLGVERVGVHDNFFDLGGHSISSFRIVVRLRERGWAPEVRDLFAHQTVAELATALQERADRPVATAPVATARFATAELEPGEIEGLLGLNEELR